MLNRRSVTHRRSSGNRRSLTPFFRPVCKLCKSVRTDYMRAASRIAGKKFLLAAVDCEDNSGTFYSGNIKRIYIYFIYIYIYIYIFYIVGIA